MKIKFDSDDNTPLNKLWNHHNLTVVVGSVFQEDSKFHPQIFLDDSLYELYENTLLYELYKNAPT